MLSMWGCNCIILGGCEVDGSHRITYRTRCGLMGVIKMY